MSRAVAVVVAIGLIVGAVVVRNVVIDGEDAGGGGRPASELVIVCATDLRAACDDLDGDVRVEDAEFTATALASGADDIDVWVAPAPWIGIVEDGRTRAGRAPLFTTTTPVARSQLVVVGPVELDGCDWRCIGDRAGADLDLGARPFTSGIGTLHLGALASGFFGSDSFAANDFDTTFTAWLAALVDGTTTTPQPVTRLLQSQAFFDAALSYEAEAKPVFDAASEDRRAGLAVAYPRPMAFVDAVVASVGDVGDDTADDVATSAAGALTAAGWTDGRAGDDGLPRAGVLVALRELV